MNTSSAFIILILSLQNNSKWLKIDVYQVLTHAGQHVGSRWSHKWANMWAVGGHTCRPTCGHTIGQP